MIAFLNCSQICFDVVREELQFQGLFFEVLFRNVFQGNLVAFFSNFQYYELFFQSANFGLQSLVLIKKATGPLLIVQNLVL